jgi:hypothetical protein
VIVNRNRKIRASTTRHEFGSSRLAIQRLGLGPDDGELPDKPLGQFLPIICPFSKTDSFPFDL